MLSKPLGCQDIELPDDGSIESLRRLDAALCVNLLRLSAGQRCETPVALEVGVYRGGWTQTVLRNVHDAQVTGVDPYPFLDHEREFMTIRLKQAGLDHRFWLFAAWSDLPHGHQSPHLIHVDGEHSEDAVLRDLRRAEAISCPQTVVAVDDWAAPFFVGVTAGVFRFIMQSSFRPFLITRKKIYLGRPPYARHLQAELLEMTRSFDLGIRLQDHYGADMSPAGTYYVSSTEVRGHPVLVATEINRVARSRLVRRLKRFVHRPRRIGSRDHA